MSSSGRRLCAAPMANCEYLKVDAPSGQDASSNSNLPGDKPRRTLIESACAACRKRKSRCNGQRPSCTRCRTLKTECIYEAEEGESRWSALKRRSQCLEYECSNIRMLLDQLRSTSGPEALDLFHRIRNNGYEGLLRQMQLAKEGKPSPDVWVQGSSSDQQLPPISTVYDAARPIGSHPGHQTISRTWDILV